MIAVGGYLWHGYGANFEAMAPEEKAEALAEWSPTREQLDEQIGAYRGGYVGLVAFRAPFVFMAETMFFLLFFLWRSGGMMVLGIALMKTGILTGERSARFYAAMGALGYLIGIPPVVRGMQLLEGVRFAMPERIGPDLYNYFASVPVALGHAGVLLLLLKLGILRTLTERLAAVGRMAFSNYLAHSVICGTLFYGYGGNLFSEYDYAEQLIVVAAVWALQLLWSAWWLRRFHFGPAEWLWRSLTYWRRQPMRRRDEATR